MNNVEKADLGLIGLAVMGQNLVLNMNDHGFSVAVFNRTVRKVDAFLSGPASGRDTVYGARSLEEFISLLKHPRKVMLMVKAGEVVDAFIEKLLPFLDEGDIIIDGGNSHFPDTERRTADLAEKGILFVGTGVSGGEEGARLGPSLMPGGNPEAWPQVRDILQSIAAKTDSGEVCCQWVGENGAGHFVKMVHNGIEYGDMQLISEAYHLMKSGLNMTCGEMHEVFAQWNSGALNSYLIEITRDILAFKDEDGEPLVEKILDKAGQKGTGKWTGISALELGMPVTLIGEAVFARCLSALKTERTAASKVFSGPDTRITGERDSFLKDLEKALLASKLVSYAQGFMLMREAAAEYSWNLNYSDIALMWRGGCIIRSSFLGEISRAFKKDGELSNLMLDDFFKGLIESAQGPWRRVVAQAAGCGIPLPAMSTALAFFDGFRTENLPANLLQAQRDYFGAHTYERKDRPRGEFFHTNWTGKGGKVSSGTYDA